MPTQGQFYRGRKVVLPGHADHVVGQCRDLGQMGRIHRLIDHRRGGEHPFANGQHEIQGDLAGDNDDLGCVGRVLFAQVGGQGTVVGGSAELRRIEKLDRQVDACFGMRGEDLGHAAVELDVRRQQPPVGEQHQHVARLCSRGGNGAKHPQTHNQKTLQQVSQPRGRATGPRTGSHNQDTLSFAGC
jgi:hypothetical protein